MATATVATRARNTGFHITSAALAVLFLLPLLWTLYSSVHGREAANGGLGWGVANYRRLIQYGNGLPTYLLNTAIVALVAVTVTVVTPTPKSDQDAIGRTAEFWDALGSRVKFMAPEEHDRALAMTSHLPHLLASALAEEVGC